MARKKITQNDGSDGENGGSEVETTNDDTSWSGKKRDNFVRLASGRVSRAIDALSALQKLANTVNYDWTPDDIEKIIYALNDKVSAVANAFDMAQSPTGEKPVKRLSFIL